MLHHLHYITDCESRISDLRIMADISFRLFLVLLLGIQSWLYAEGQGGMIEKHALIGQEVNLICYLNSTENVTWLYNIHGDFFLDIYTCQDNQNSQCRPTNTESRWASFYTELKFQATRGNETSILSLIPPDEAQLDFKCELGNNILQEYLVKPIDPSKLASYCSVTSPSINVNGVGSITLSCEVNSGELDVNLTLEGMELNVRDDSPASSKIISASKTLYFDNFNNVHDVFCNAYFPDIDITRSCTYPNIIKAQYIVEGNDIIVECDYESNVVYWRFYGSDGEEDIKERSLIRDGGRSLLIRDISEQDVGKVVVCRTKGDDNQTNKGTIGFIIISKLTGDNDEYNSEEPASTASARNVYFVLTILFLVLWLITNSLCGVWLGYRLRRSHEVSTIPRKSDNEQTQKTPQYATAVLSTNGRSDLDIQRESKKSLHLENC